MSWPLGDGGAPPATRRRFLKQAAAGALLASAAPLRAAARRGSPAGERAAASSGAPAPAPGDSRPVDPARVQEIADLLRTSPQDAVFDRAAERIRRGASLREMVGGVLLAGVHDVRPWPPGVKFHAVLMAPSALQLAEAAEGEDAWLPVFFNVQVLKDSQETDAREGDWRLPPAPPASTEDPDRARRLLTDSLERWHLETADRAAVAAARVLDLDDLFEVLWPMGARDVANIGHLMIHASQAHRALRMLEGGHREPVVRSLVHGLLGGGPGRTTVAFERSRERLREFPAGWEAGRPDPEAAREILVKLRAASPDQAVDLTISLLRRGVAAGSVWDGLRLFASECLYRLAGSTAPDAQLLGVHPMTILNAFGHASRAARREETRRLLLLQAAAWMPAARDVLSETKGLSMKGPGLDGLEAPGEAPAGVEAALEAAGRSSARAAVLSLGLARDPRHAAALVARLRTLTLRKASEHHHHKYAAALFEDLPGTDAAWSAHLLAVAPTYLAKPADPDSEITKRARAALKRAGA